MGEAKSFRIESKSASWGWSACAYPGYDLPKALELLDLLVEKGQERLYRRELRLVELTTRIIRHVGSDGKDKE